jgi:hypothetical protein
MLEINSEIFRFVLEIIALRARYPVFSRDAFYTEGDITWFGPEGQAPDWDGPTRALGCLIRHAEVTCEPAASHSLCLLFNANDLPVEFCLPPGVRDWWIEVDTGREAPNDIFAVSAEHPLLRPCVRSPFWRRSDLAPPRRWKAARGTLRGARRSAQTKVSRAMTTPFHAGGSRSPQPRPQARRAPGSSGRGIPRRANKRSATLPSMSRRTTRRVCVPITTRSAVKSAAATHVRYRYRRLSGRFR